LTRDENRIVSWSDDGTVRLWDATTGRQIGPSMKHDNGEPRPFLGTAYDAVKGALLTRDETRILSWSRDRTVRLWDVATGKQIGRAMQHDEFVQGALLTHDETRVVSWSDDGTVRLWDATTGRQIGPSMKHDRDVKGALLTRDEARILSWSQDGTVRLWDIATAEQIGPEMTHDSEVFGAQLTRDETRILSWSEDGTVRLWNVSWRGRNLFEIACNYSPPEHDLSAISERYGVKIADLICQLNEAIPSPDWSSREPPSAN
jgi:WD40 repeat protein